MIIDQKHHQNLLLDSYKETNIWPFSVEEKFFVETILVFDLVREKCMDLNRFLLLEKL